MKNAIFATLIARTCVERGPGCTDIFGGAMGRQSGRTASLGTTVGSCVPTGRDKPGYSTARVFLAWGGAELWCWKGSAWRQSTLTDSFLHLITTMCFYLPLQHRNYSTFWDPLNQTKLFSYLFLFPTPLDLPLLTNSTWGCIWPESLLFLCRCLVTSH